MSVDKPKKMTEDRSEQFVDFAAGVDVLCISLKQEQLQNESLRREFHSLQLENYELNERIEQAKSEREESRKDRLSLQTALEAERRSRQAAERKLKESIAMSAHRQREMDATFAAEEADHRAELVRQRELALMEILSYREEFDQLLQRYETLREKSQSRFQEECSDCRELQSRISAEAEANNFLRDELEEKEASLSNAQIAAEQARNEVARIRRQMAKIDRISEVQTLMNNEKLVREQFKRTIENQSTQSNSPTSSASFTSKLRDFHPDRLNLEADLADTKEGAHA